MYRAVFSRRAEKALLGLSIEDARRIHEALEELRQEPRGPQTINLDNAPVAEYRRRVGSYRILFDIDDSRLVLQVLDVRRRNERTYR